MQEGGCYCRKVSLVQEGSCLCRKVVAGAGLVVAGAVSKVLGVLVIEQRVFLFY